MKNLKVFSLCISMFYTFSYLCAQTPTETKKIRELHRKSLKRFITPQGKIIDYKFSNNSATYQLQWGTKNFLRTLDDKISLDDSERIFFEAENNDFILMHQSCGSPCFIGIFLPMDIRRKPIYVSEYQAYNLHDNLVAYFNYDKLPNFEIVIKNLKTEALQKVIVRDTCTSAFPGYCISMAIRNRTLYYRWSKSAFISKDDKTAKRVNIKI